MKTSNDKATLKAKYDRIDWDKASDEMVIAAILDRENGIRTDRAWHELFKRYDATINKRVRSIIGNCSRAFRSSDTFEEIRAEIIASLLSNDMRKLRAFDPKKGTLGALLSKIAHHAAIDHLTKIVNGGVPDPIEAIDADACDAGYGEEDRDVLGDGQIGARWLGGVSMSTPQRLVSIIQAASVFVVDEKRLLVFAWFGDDKVHVFDRDGDEVHRFAVDGHSDDDVREAIERVRTSTKLDRDTDRDYADAADAEAAAAALLGVTPEATEDDIRAAFRRCVKAEMATDSGFHDHGGDTTDPRAQRLNAAKNLLIERAKENAHVEE